MNTKLLTIVIIFFSLISWIIWSYMGFTLFYNNWNNREVHDSINILNLENEIVKKVEDISPSVVNIIIKKDLTIYKSDPWWFFQTPVWSIQRKVWWGTWFFITKDGIIITNKHVISDKNAEYTVITKDKKEYDAVILATDPLNDIAIIKIDTSDTFTPLEFISEYEWMNSDIKIWQFAIAIWNALAEFQNSVSLWVVSGINRNIEAGWDKLSWLLQTDAAINPWNSWWPLLNLNGKVMWINTAIVWWSQWIWFSIPLSTKKITYILESIKKYGSIKKPFIGINYTVISESIRQQLWIKQSYWALINSTLNWSNAKKIGLEKWDIILEIESQPITINNDLISLIQNKIPWENITLKILKTSWDIINQEIELWIEK